jgi:hypothetical protein
MTVPAGLFSRMPLEVSVMSVGELFSSMITKELDVPICCVNSESEYTETSNDSPESESTVREC